MGMTQIEDIAGNVAETINNGGGVVELAVSIGEYSIDDEDGMVSASLLLTPRQARALARQLLAEADAAEYDDEG